MLPRRIEELQAQRPIAETVRGLRDATLAWLDEDLLSRDFPGLRTAGREPGAWLISRTAFLSEPQAGQSEVNTPVVTTARRATAWRPRAYGRAAVLPVEGGLIDVKGIGVAPGAVPGPTLHSNGLLVLGEALREVIVERLLRAVFRHAGLEIGTVGNYAVLTLGFAVRHGDRQMPAGLLLRQAHRRPVYRFGFKEQGSREAEMEIEIELLLRRYGLTSAGEGTTIEVARHGDGVRVIYGGTPVALLEHELRLLERHAEPEGEVERFKGANVQLTDEVLLDPQRARIVDFAGFQAEPRFTSPLVSLVAGRLARMGEILRPESPRFVQPDPEVCLPYDLLGGDRGVFGFGPSEVPPCIRVNNARILAYGLARQHAAGEIGTRRLGEILDTYTDAATAHWRRAHTTARPMLRFPHAGRGA